MKQARAKAKRLVIDATAQKPREQTQERGPVLEREMLRASIQEHAVAKLQRLVAQLNG